MRLLSLRGSSSCSSESALHRVASASRGASFLGERSGTPGEESLSGSVDGVPAELAGSAAGRRPERATRSRRLSSARLAAVGCGKV